MIVGGGQQTGPPVYMLWRRRMANRSRFLSDRVLRVKWVLARSGPTKPRWSWNLRFFCFSNTMSRQSDICFFFSFLENKTFSPPHLCLHFPLAYQRNPIGTCFAYLHLISNFKRTCQNWSSFLFWMCEDYLACIISASTCNAATKQNKLISNGTRGTFYTAFH